jgi:hypothetical protein
VRRAAAYPLYVSPCPVLPATLSQLFPIGDHPSKRGRQNFAAALSTDDNRSAGTDTEIIIITVGCQSQYYSIVKVFSAVSWYRFEGTGKTGI